MTVSPRDDGGENARRGQRAVDAQVAEPVVDPEDARGHLPDPDRQPGLLVHGDGVDEPVDLGLREPGHLPLGARRGPHGPAVDHRLAESHVPRGRHRAHRRAPIQGDRRYVRRPERVARHDPPRSTRFAEPHLPADRRVVDLDGGHAPTGGRLVVPRQAVVALRVTHDAQVSDVVARRVPHVAGVVPHREVRLPRATGGVRRERPVEHLGRTHALRTRGARKAGEKGDGRHRGDRGRQQRQAEWTPRERRPQPAADAGPPSLRGASATRRRTSRQYSGPWSGSPRTSRPRPSSVSRVSSISQSAARLVDGPRQQRSVARAVLRRDASVPVGTPRMAAVVA